MKWVNLIHVVAVLGPGIWLYLRHGWRAGYKADPSAKVLIDHHGTPLAVREMRSKFGWPIMALIEIPLKRRSRFSVRLQPRTRLSADIAVGHAGFDEMFLIGGESLRLAEQLRVRGDLRSHLVTLPARLARDQAKLSRVIGENGKLELEVNVRWTSDRPRLYRALLVWLVEFERLLSLQSADSARKPERDPEHGVSPPSDHPVDVRASAAPDDRTAPATVGARRLPRSARGEPPVCAWQSVRAVVGEQ